MKKSGCYRNVIVVERLIVYIVIKSLCENKKWLL